MLQTSLKILVIEDNPGDYFLVKDYLEDGLDQPVILHSDTLKKASEILGNDKINLILLDLTLPDGMGIESFNHIHKIAPKIPIIILSGFGDTHLALETLKLGAQDYIVKGDCNSMVLSKSIQYGIERSKIFDHLKKSEEQYKYLFYSNPLPMWAYGKASHKFLMVNEAAIAHYGFSEEEFLSLSVNDLIVNGESGKKDTTVTESGSGTYTIDLKHLKKDGAIIDVEVGTHDIVVEGAHACLAVIHDVTERNKAKEQLRESEQKFRTISENFPNGAVAILDKNFRILYMAGKQFHIPSVDASYFADTLYTRHFTSPHKENVEENLKKVFEGESVVFEAGYQHDSYMISAVPLYEADGNVHQIVIASQNITGQKQNELEKEMLIEELTQNNSDLRQFSYITSHNLRAPLSNLLGIIKLLDTSSITDPMTTLLINNFEECTLQLNDTVNDLINVLIIKNNVNAKKEKLLLSKTYERVVHSIQTTIDQFEMTVETDFSEADEVEFNRAYLESILLNLLTNAVKYSSPKRKPRVTIKTKILTDGVKMYFSDNGLGIDLDRYKDRIFGLYQRFHDHADSKGLGLYIVNSQIRVMGGEIELESEVDKGTTFIITFKN